MGFAGFLSRPTSALCLAVLAGFGALASATAAPLIIDGTATVATEFPEVFALTFSRDGRVAPAPCTATLVHPKVLLTAAHCLPEDESIVVEVREGVDLRHPTRTHSVAFTRVHEAYVYTHDPILQTGYDFGLVVLETPIADVTPARLASLATPAARRRLFAADALTVVGYGGTQKLGLDGTTGTQRRGTTRALEAIEQQFSTEGPHAALSIGDSGGPAYLGHGGARTLVGVASGAHQEPIYQRDGRPGVSLYAAIRPAILDWIESEAGVSLGTRETPARDARSTPRSVGNDPFAHFGER